MLELRAENSVLVVLPEVGGAIGSWERAGHAILHPVSDPNLVAQKLRAVAAYPLIPFSNRVGYARFEFGGETFELARNFAGEPHAIHGNAWERSWTVAHREPARAVLSLDHAPPEDPAEQWPFRYRATIDYRLRDDGLSVILRVENTDRRPQPVGLGFHPFYPRTTEVELGFAADSVLIAGPDSLPAEQVAVEGEWRFSPMRPLDGPPLDNCFRGWDGSAFMRWPDRGYALTLTASEPLRHLVVFSPPGKDYFAVEPASNMTDAIHHPDDPNRGLVLLKPGEAVEATVEFALARL
ncbi:aldose 1-epimerase [Rhizosaccharibacter radicis]|uniref:Aldose 1-epimerase n=1 Tax=Rhizosaccharibacter radicis TaxID=2782605 RepID=A0ABT1VX48_9PROT|nr:aldose 1-epimerase [Acetobacteraceae bacterium KSS12]